ncbi:MAG: heme-binding protein [Syntrophobacteraceae bacterium]|nr:heme-binding protein [Syntrophobacteraceae bacterium]
MATEEAKFTVLEKRGDFELRRYEPQIVAETVVRGDFSSVGNEAFQRLFGYISGGNRKSRSIPMTAPVSQESQSEKIAMTAPVSQEQVGDQWRLAFVMPAQYKLADLPEPNDSRVSLREIPGRTMATLSYSGTWSKKRYDKKMEILLGRMNELGLRPIGEPVFARYNPPFTPWFLRRNEILIPVERP